MSVCKMLPYSEEGAAAYIVCEEQCFKSSNCPASRNCLVLASCELNIYFFFFLLACFQRNHFHRPAIVFAIEHHAATE